MSEGLKNVLGTDGCKKAVVVGVAGGYLLGRTKKLKLALTLGAVVAGRRLGLNPQELISKGVRKVTELPQFEQLSDQVRDELMAAARTAVSSVVGRRVGSLSGLLQERTRNLNGEAEEPEEEEPEEPEGDDEAEEEEEPEGEEEEEEEEEKPDRSARRRAKRTHRHEKPPPPERPAKKAAKRADQPRKGASKSAAGRTGKKAPAKKTAAKKTSPRSGQGR